MAIVYTLVYLLIAGMYSLLLNYMVSYILTIILANCCSFFSFLEPNVLAGTLVAHTDAVWGLAYSGIKNQLLSCSADGTVRLWSPQEKLPCICTYNGDKGK